MRFLPTKTRPVVKNYQKIRLHLDSFFDDTLNNKYPEILNSGEITDSLMQENGEAPFSIFIASIFENQRQHNVLFLTKSNNIGNLLKTGSDKIVPSFTINACLVAKKWEKGAPDVRKRIEAAKTLYESGYPIRIRIDPMVPIEGWNHEYIELVDDLFSHFAPERITLGSLRGLQSTINNSKDSSWTEYLSEKSN
jgi:DNA repair photolyase